MAKKIKVVFMGTPDFALSSLLALLDDPDIEVQAVITQEDKKTGRKQVLTPPPVKTLALEYGATVLQPPSLKDNAQMTVLLRELKPDFIVVVAYGQILPPEILQIPKYDCINIHGSLLPQYRGASPVEAALLNGDGETGITFIRMSEKLDAGPIYHLQRTTIAPDDDAATLRAKLAAMAGSLLPSVLKDIIANEQQPIPQDDSRATYCGKISKENGKIDLKKLTARQVKNRLRAYHIWPGCYLELQGKKIKLLSVETDVSSDLAQKLSPYETAVKPDGKLAIGTRQGLIIPLEIQLEGKKPMKIQDFMRGNKDLLIKLLESAK